MKIKSILYISFLTLALLISPFVNAKTAKFNQSQVQQIQQIVHDYLVNNPEVLVEASNALQEKQFTTAVKKVKSSIPANFDSLFQTNGQPVAGNPKGNVVLVEIFDYQCPHCKPMTPIVDKLIKANSDLKVIFIEWPIFGPNSQYAARAALASMQQNKYYSFHNALFKKGYPLNKIDVLNIAKSLGINTKKLQYDMQNSTINEQLKNNFILAQKLNIGPPLGTPMFFIGNTKTKKFQVIPGQADQDDMQKAIDAVK
jgi:protein-disulfide isomerase